MNPEYELIPMMETEKIPLNFGLTAKNMLAENIILTPVDNDDEIMTYFKIIMRVGDRLKSQAEIKLNDEHNEALQRKVEELMQEKNNTLNEKIRPAEQLRYEKRLSIVMDKFNDSKIAKAKHCIKMNIMNKCKKEMEKNSIKIARCLKNILKMSSEKLEKEMRNDFNYQMQLARNELYEEFMEEKCECELFWEKELRAVKEKNNRELKHLEVSLEAEHVQNLIALEHWYEIENRKKMLEQKKKMKPKYLKKEKKILPF